MDLVTHAVLVMSAVAFTLGLLYLRFWISQTDRKDFLLFALACFSAAVYAWFEMAIMNIDSIPKMASALWWAQLPAGLAIIFVASFLYRYLDAGDKWLYWGAVVTRGLGIVLNFFLTPSINFRRIVSINFLTVLDERISIPVGEGSAFSLVNHVALVLLLAFCIDAMVEVWTRGERRKAVVFGGGVALFVIYVAFVSISVSWLPIGLPVLASPAIMFVVLAMGYELNYDLHRSARLAKALEASEAELRESVRQLKLSAEAADVGVWIRSADGEIIWASEKWYELLDLDPRGPLTLKAFLAKLDVADREPIKKDLTRNYKTGDEFETEYRVLPRNGDVRWIRGRGRAEETSEGTLILRGASVDITKLKTAQEAAHDLSRKLMNAQEKERARLARELHDDLSQSLALLSIQLHSAASKVRDPDALSSQLGNITTQIDRLSSDVHRISHELHPSKLEQLGLVAALRGICREIGAAHGLKVDFRAENLPKKLPNDISLCLYRVAQESLQNVVKHSSASNALVELQLNRNELCLTVSDNGCGFDATASSNLDGIGLVSMKERLRAVDGTVHIESSVGAGTKVLVSVPFKEAQVSFPEIASSAIAH